VPVMSLGDDLMKLSISGGKRADPVSDATKKGKVPTLGEVKRSLKACLFPRFIGTERLIRL
jgi:meiosis-specific protein